MRKLQNAFLMAVAAVAVIGTLLTASYTQDLKEQIKQVERTSRADMNYLRHYIRNLETDLNASVIDKIVDRLDAISRPTGGDALGGNPAITETETEAVTETEAMSETDTETATETDVPETLPTAVISPEEETLTEEETTVESLPVTGGESESRDGTAGAIESDVESDAETATEPEGESDTPETETIELPTHDRPETLPPETPSTLLYTVGAYEGRIGVFDATGRLIRTVNVFLFALPESDREALAVGIPAYSREEMLRIVERYE